MLLYLNLLYITKGACYSDPMKVLAFLASIFLAACAVTKPVIPFVPPTVVPVKQKIHDAKEVVALAKKSNYDGKTIILHTRTLSESLRAKLEQLKHLKPQ